MIKAESSTSSPTLSWIGDACSGFLRVLDQRKLPKSIEFIEVRNVSGAYDCINQMVVRGAPAIGIVGAFSMVLALQSIDNKSDMASTLEQLKVAKDEIESSRPTAVNLSWALEQMYESALKAQDRESIADELLSTAQKLASDDIDINQRIAKHGATVVPSGANILHHCNTGRLATVGIGTALGVIYECHSQGKGVHVWVDETRPRLQGARLTAWELMQEGVPMHLISDNAAGSLMLNGKVDIVLFGADRVTANGDVVNKVGTYKLAVCAKENKIPVFAVVPTSTIDFTIETGEEVPIEERSDDEVTQIGSERIAPKDCPVYNPAFDMTPHRYLTGIITENGICYPPFQNSLAEIAQNNSQQQEPIVFV